MGQLTQLLEHWQGLTQAETQAIEREDWGAVARQQRLKAGLRPEINRLREQQPLKPSAQPASSPEEQRLRQVLQEVMLLETRNSESLATKRQIRRQELRRLNQAAHHLHGARRAYGRTPQHCWQSYS